MATVTKPIALDESINTTEQTPRNIADVLAEELAGIAGAITTSESVEDILSDMATTKDAQVISGTAVFDTIDGNLVKALKVAITPSQAGSGTPSPSNIRPISGYTEEVISVKDSTDTTQETYTTPFNQTVYGGTLDVLTGELTIDKWYVQITAQNVTFSSTNNRGLVRTNVLSIPDAVASNNTINCICDKFEPITQQQGVTTGEGIYASGQIIAICGYKTSLAEYQSWLTDNPVTVVYTLATPTALSLTPQTVKALVGENHIQASTGDVLQCKYSMMINGDDLSQLLT